MRAKPESEYSRLRAGAAIASMASKEYAQFILTRANTPNAVKMEPTTPRKTLPLVLGETMGARGPWAPYEM